MFRFDFTTEVSGFFVRRLSLPLPSDAACSAATDSSAADTCAAPGVTDPVDPEPGANVSRVEAATPITAASASAAEDVRPPEGSHIPPIPVSGATVGDAAAGHSDGDGGDEGEGTALTESAVEATSVVEESNASKAVWKRARPRVRYFTHQVGSKSEGDDMITPSSYQKRSASYIQAGRNLRRDAELSCRKHAVASLAGARRAGLRRQCDIHTLAGFMLEGQRWHCLVL